MAARAEVVLTGEEREVLQRWARRPKSSQALALRCRIVLAAAEGRSSIDIAAELGCNHNTVSKWRGRFARRGFDGLHDEPRPGKPRTISDEQVERVIVKTLEAQPAGATHWSTRSMAQATGMSQSAISRIWRAFGLKPHQTEAFKLSPDPQFIDKVRDIVGLYLQPTRGGDRALRRREGADPGARPVGAGAGADARGGRAAQAMATSATAPPTSTRPSTSPRDAVISEMTPRHRAEEFRRFLNLIEKSVPPHLDLHLVVDNSSTHKTPAIQRWLVRHPRFTLHFTPTYSSWLNLVERWFAELTTKWIKRGSHRSVRDLVASIRTWIANWNDDPKPFVWHKTADEILENLAAYCQRINDSGH